MNQDTLTLLYKALLDLLVTILIPAIVAVALTAIKNGLEKSQVFKNEIVRQVVVDAVNTVEQLYRSGKLKGIEMSSQDKFEEALDIAQRLLEAQGVKTELHLLGTRIEAAVWSEINSQLPVFLQENVLGEVKSAGAKPADTPQ